MKKAICLLLLFMFVACVSHKIIYDIDYKGEPNYKSFYVVDTIKIDDPIVIEFAGRFVCSKKILDTVKINKTFFQRPDVFILVDDLYYDLLPVDYYKYFYPDYGNCDIEFKTEISKTKIYLYEYKIPPAFFILGLINANYYNEKHRTIDGNWYRINTPDQKISYYKIVYPLC
jgi:hypothetical protein